jgi:hypothetical protein
VFHTLSSQKALVLVGFLACGLDHVAGTSQKLSTASLTALLSAASRANARMSFPQLQAWRIDAFSK